VITYEKKRSKARRREKAESLPPQPRRNGRDPVVPGKKNTKKPNSRSDRREEKIHSFPEFEEVMNRLVSPRRQLRRKKKSGTHHQKGRLPLPTN